MPLKWVEGGNALLRRIARLALAPSGGGTTMSLGTQTGTTYSDGTGTPGTSYDYTVAAANIVGNRTSTDTGTPLVAPPPPPRANDHEEGLVDGKCECGSLPAGPSLLLPGLAALLILAAALRRLQ